MNGANDACRFIAAIVLGGEQEAHARLSQFLAVDGAAYHTHRDRMDIAGTRRLSADLKFGTISPRQVWNAVADALGDTPASRVFLNEL